MGAVQGWDRRRYATLAAVVALHATLLVLAWLYSPALHSGGAAPRALELLYLPPSPPSKIRPDNFRPQRIGSDAVISVVSPAAGELPLAPMSGADGNGTGVDWRAESRRALQAFEIRNNTRSNGPEPSRASADMEGWQGARHRPGEQYKTDSGDWIVWIDSSCYQVAKAGSSSALGAVLPQTTCPGQEPPVHRAQAAPGRQPPGALKSRAAPR